MIAFGRYEGDDLPFRWAQPDVHSDAPIIILAEGRLTSLPSARSYVVPWLARAE